MKANPVGIAIVDDDHDYAQTLAELLDLEEALTVVGIASTVADGLTLLANPAVELGLIDVHMPGGGGVLVVEMVGRWQRAPVLALISANEPSPAVLHASAVFVPKDQIRGCSLVELARAA